MDGHKSQEQQKEYKDIKNTVKDHSIKTSNAKIMVKVKIRTHVNGMMTTVEQNQNQKYQKCKNDNIPLCYHNLLNTGTYYQHQSKTNTLLIHASSVLTQLSEHII